EDVHLVDADEMEQKIEGALERRQLDLICGYGRIRSVSGFGRWPGRVLGVGSRRRKPRGIGNVRVPLRTGEGREAGRFVGSQGHRITTGIERQEGSTKRAQAITRFRRLSTTGSGKGPRCGARARRPAAVAASSVAGLAGRRGGG